MRESERVEFGREESRKRRERERPPLFSASEEVEKEEEGGEGECWPSLYGAASRPFFSAFQSWFLFFSPGGKRATNCAHASRCD